MRLRRSLVFIGFLVLGICYTAFDAVGGDAPSRGRQILLNRGLQIGTSVFADVPGYPGNFDLAVWGNSHFTTLNCQDALYPDLLARIPGQTWSRWYTPTISSTKFLSVQEQPYADGLVALEYGDEPSDIMTPSRLADMESTYSAWRSRYSNILAFAHSSNPTSSGPPLNLTDLTTYMWTAKPDMLVVDDYPGFWFNNTIRNWWYEHSQLYRTAALAGDDGTGQQPLPYGKYINLYRDHYSDPLPSESFVRMQQFTSWAFGFTYLSTYYYNDPHNSAAGVPALFSAPGTTATTPVFDYVAETNRQSRNLGLALVRLVSTDIRMIPGSGTLLPPAAFGTSIAGWVSGHLYGDADGNNGGNDYITGITPLGKVGNPDPNVYSDIVIGYFKPLLSDNSGYTFADGLHFMIVNGASGNVIPVDSNGVADPAAMAAGSAAALAERYHITFNFTGSDFNSLVRLSRDTGQVELVSLTPYGPEGNKTYFLDLTLEGGTGDLFRYWNSSDPLPTIPEPGAFTSLIIGLPGLLVYVWRQRNQSLGKEYHISQHSSANDFALTE